MRVVIFAIALLLCSCSQSGRYRIEGQSAQEGKYYYLLTGYDVVDSAKVVNGKYIFEGDIDYKVPVRNIASTNLKNPLIISRCTQVILEEGRIRVAEVDSSPTGGLTVRGTEGNDAMYDFAMEASAIREQIITSRDREFRNQKMEEYEKLVGRVIKSNTDNYAGVLMLKASGSRYTPIERQELLERLSPQMQATDLAIELKKDVKLE